MFLTGNTGQLDLEYFKAIGFEKKVCSKCGSYYWTSDAGRNTCGDPPCDSYSFIGNSPVNRPYTMDEVREKFLSFFKGTHKLLQPYPVVPRWRDDVLLVNASIYNFQPHVTSGRVKPPGNPIVMSQPSIRMVDTDLVGETGRHLTSFEMMCHDSFNYPENFVYWKEQTVEYCHRFLTEELGIDGRLVTYKEKPWSGGGNGGYAFEPMVSGLEVATLVFMDMQADPDGDVEIDGQKYSRMDMMIVDTGYGLERMVWLSQGTPTIYQAVLPYAIDHITANSSVTEWDPAALSIFSRLAAEVEPFDRDLVLEKTKEELLRSGISLDRERMEQAFENSRAIYILADHTKTLMTLFSDYVIPSNVKVGYLARLLIRRALRAGHDCGYSGTLFDLIRLHHSHLDSVISNFPSGFIREALEEEENRFRELEQKSESIVLRTFDRKGELSEKDLLTLYDSSGIMPETAARIVLQGRGKKVTVPGDFNSLVSTLHEKHQERRKPAKEYPGLFTRPLYYDDASISEFNALVLYSEGNTIIPNQTAFYPEGGGQPTDLGYFTYHGKKVMMEGAQKHGTAIVHNLDSPIPEHSRIIGHVDFGRRRRLMVHHSATHLLLGVLREVLGDHVWQSGVQKGTDRSRIDITHFRKLTDEQASEVERRCLHYIMEGREITARNIEWNKALARYGFRLFEGGVPDGKTIRVVEIQGVDAEGCGGTHVKSTSELGFIKIIRVDTIQEGIQRITFTAGDAALDYVQEIYSTEQLLESQLSVPPEKAAEAFNRLLAENVDLKKERERRLRDTVDRAIASSTGLDLDGVQADYISGRFDESEMKGLVSALFSLRKELAVVQNSVEGQTEIRIISGKLDAMEICGCFSDRFGSTPSGTKRHAWIRGNIDTDVTLIRSILHSCRPRSS